MINYILYYTCCAISGFTMGYLGYPALSWEFWAVIGPMVIASNIKLNK